jgi:hypothetical protein
VVVEASLQAALCGLAGREHAQPPDVMFADVCAPDGYATVVCDWLAGPAPTDHETAARRLAVVAEFIDRCHARELRPGVRDALIRRGLAGDPARYLDAFSSIRRCPNVHALPFVAVEVFAVDCAAAPVPEKNG